MLKFYFIFTLSTIVLLPIESYGQENIFSLRFCAANGVPGHSFVHFERYDPVTSETLSYGAFGLYPMTKTSGIKSLIFGTVPGRIVDDTKHLSDISYTVHVSETNFKKAVAIKNQWAARPNYEAGEKDCVSFINEIALSLRLKVPPRTGQCLLPYWYLKRMRELNQ